MERTVGAAESPIGNLPLAGELNLQGLELTEESVRELFDVNTDNWLRECDLIDEFFTRFGDRIPAALNAELAALRYHLEVSDR